ncbi:MAG: RDD family protein [Moraxella sp.]|nr:RDD family protein [Moraxella sp.]
MNQNNPYQSPQEYEDDYDDTEYEYAGFWIRFVAYLIDMLAVILILTPVLILMIWLNLASWDNEGYDLGDAVSQVLGAVFYIFCWVRFATTPGKYLFKLKILDADTGEHLTPFKAFLRYIGYIPSAIIMGLGFIWIAFDDRKQGWHDKIANSVVVKEIR